MSRAHGIGLLALVILAGALWWWTAAERSRGRSLAGGAVERSPGSERALAVVPAGDPPDEIRSLQERVVAAPPPSASPDDWNGHPSMVKVSARLVDERGAALADGRLSVRLADGREAAEGREDGEVELAFDLTRMRDPRSSVEAWAPGCVCRRSRVERAALAEAGALFLGEIRLGPGGSLAGRVVDGSGAPVPDATLNEIGRASCRERG